jgi:hypothetical protein
VEAAWNYCLKEINDGDGRQAFSEAMKRKFIGDIEPADILLIVQEQAKARALACRQEWVPPPKEPAPSAENRARIRQLVEQLASKKDIRA